jgi:hypothetical protein
VAREVLNQSEIEHTDSGPGSAGDRARSATRPTALLLIGVIAAVGVVALVIWLLLTAFY